MRRAMVIMVAVLAALAAQAQGRTVHDEFDFVMYLIGHTMRDDAVIAVERTALTGDSIDFLKGYAYYNARRLDSAAAAFGRVGEGSPLFAEAMLFASISDAHLGRYGQAADHLAHITSADAQTSNMVSYELAGLRLLQRDYDAFDALMAATDTSDYRIASEAANLLQVRHTLADRGRRSPWVAGTLSALVPGLGKVYAGNLGEGLAAFLVTGSLMAVTAENWIKECPTNWKTIAAGVLSAVFYVGNIYGSVATVKVNLHDFNQRNDVQILYDIHIPLRTGYRR